MSEACPLPLYPETQNCSGRSIAPCINNECVCQEGWTGQGDFVVGAPTCDIFIPAIQGLWGVSTFLHCLAVMFSSRSLFLARSDQLTAARLGALLPHRKYWFTRPSVFITLICLVCSLCIIVLGALKIALPSETIGSSAATTVFFSIGSTLFWSFAPMIAFVFISLNLKQLKTKNSEAVVKMRATVQRFGKILPFCWVATTTACIQPMFMLLSPEPQVMYILTAVHYLGIAVTMVAYFIVVRLFIHPLTEDIRHVLHLDGIVLGSGDEKLKSIAWKFDRFSAEVVNQALVQSVIACFFGFFPYVQRLASYQLPIAWMLTAPIMVSGMYAISTTRASAGKAHTRTVEVLSLSGSHQIKSGEGRRALTALGHPTGGGGHIEDVVSPTVGSSRTLEEGRGSVCNLNDLRHSRSVSDNPQAVDL